MEKRFREKKYRIAILYPQFSRESEGKRGRKRGKMEKLVQGLGGREIWEMILKLKL